MAKRNYLNCVKFDSWAECVEALKTEYTISTSILCEWLKCDRSWVYKYIRDHVSYIYLSKGYNPKKYKRKNTEVSDQEEKDLKYRGKDYTKLATKDVEREITDSVWLNTNETIQYIKSHVNLETVTRKTIYVPIELLVKREMLEHFTRQYDNLLSETPKTTEERQDNRTRRNNLIKKCMTEMGKKAFYDRPRLTERGNTNETPCNLPEYELSDLIALHAMSEKSYEEKYRTLFRNGCIKLEFNLPAKTKTILDNHGGNSAYSKKVYYLYPQKDEYEHLKVIAGIGDLDSMEDVFIKYEYLDEVINQHEQS